MPDSPDNLAYRVGQLEADVRSLESRVEEGAKMIERHEEQINGDRGLSKAIDVLTEEVRALRKVLIGVGAGTVLAAITFAFTVLTLIGGH